MLNITKSKKYDRGNRQNEYPVLRTNLPEYLRDALERIDTPKLNDTAQ